MGHHINKEGKFQSDKYPDLEPGKITLSFKDPEARRALHALADDYMEKDRELAEDIVTALANIYQGKD